MGRQGDVRQLVLGMTVIVGHVQAILVVEEADIGSHFEGVRLFPTEVWSGERGHQGSTRTIVVGLCTVGTLHGIVTNHIGIQVTVGTVAGAKLGKRDHMAELVEPRLLTQNPTGGNSGECSPTFVLVQARITVVTEYG